MLLVRSLEPFSPALVAVCRLLVAVTSVVEHGLLGMQASVLQHVGSVAATPRLWSTGSVAVAPWLICSTACEISPDQGSNPVS